jgi:hypothetical protein
MPYSHSWSRWGASNSYNHQRLPPRRGVFDKLLNDLDRQGFEVIGFADDLVITVRSNNDSILSERIGWCKQSGLSINPAKTIGIPFTRRRKLCLKNPVVGGV